MVSPGQSLFAAPSATLSLIRTKALRNQLRVGVAEFYFANPVLLKVPLKTVVHLILLCRLVVVVYLYGFC